ncbi:MAG: hypothetical protein OXC02_03895 [Rhodobacteraceae bacterium]|nr:hypothetical protein [Paracoccaceae bacterium]
MASSKEKATLVDSDDISSTTLMSAKASYWTLYHARCVSWNTLRRVLTDGVIPPASCNDK